MNYSLRRKNKIVNYIVIHYTGMQDFKSAYNKLSNLNSKVSCHYLISREGFIFNMLCPQFIAWHAGISEWRNEINLNKSSIGIELENKGHEFGYTNFTERQYIELGKLLRFLCFNFRIEYKNILYHSDIAPNRKKDPGERFFLQKTKILKKNFHYYKRYISKKENSKYSLIKLLELYGFSKNYIKLYRSDCIKSLKRALNYKKIDSTISKQLLSDLNILLLTKKLYNKIG